MCFLIYGYQIHTNRPYLEVFFFLINHLFIQKYFIIIIYTVLRVCINRNYNIKKYKSKRCFLLLSHEFAYFKNRFDG